MNCLCDIFDDDNIWFIVIIALILFCYCNYGGCRGGRSSEKARLRRGAYRQNCRPTRFERLKKSPRGGFFLV